MLCAESDTPAARPRWRARVVHDLRWRPASRASVRDRFHRGDPRAYVSRRSVRLDKLSAGARGAWLPVAAFLLAHIHRIVRKVGHRVRRDRSARRLPVHAPARLANLYRSREARRGGRDPRCCARGRGGNYLHFGADQLRRTGGHRFNPSRSRAHTLCHLGRRSTGRRAAGNLVSPGGRAEVDGGLSRPRAWHRDSVRAAWPRAASPDASLPRRQRCSSRSLKATFPLALASAQRGGKTIYVLDVLRRDPMSDVCRKRIDEYSRPMRPNDFRIGVKLVAANHKAVRKRLQHRDPSWLEAVAPQKWRRHRCPRLVGLDAHVQIVVLREQRAHESHGPLAG